MAHKSNRLRIPVVVALAAAAVATLWWVQHARASRPTVPAVAALAMQPAEGPAPGRAGTPGSLDRKVDGVAFPDWSHLGWRAIGVRQDRIGGRDAVTLRYAARPHRLTYTIVAGTDQVNYGDSTMTLYRATLHGKVELNFTSGGSYVRGAEQTPPPAALVLAFKREGRTVVMTSDEVDADQARRMVRLATEGS